MDYKRSLFFFTIFVVLSFSCESPKYPPAMSVEETLESFMIDDRFEVEVFAAEPLVQDPVSMIFDEKGDIYVVEMPDYPFKPEEGPGAGRVKKLLDTDGDGVIDDYVVFADQITDATSLMPWKDGMLVTAAPHIWYVKDTDGDGIADHREIVFSGFFQDNQEAQITNLRFNVDNWIYASNHGQHGVIHFEWDPDAEPLDISGADFRFRLDTKEFERETAPAQFGQDFDHYGERFVTQNTIHIQQMVVPSRYLSRHSYLPSTRAMTDISDHDLRMYQQTEAPYWRKVRSERRQKQYDEQGLDRIEHVDGHFTGASGGIFYGGDLFPEEFHNNLFTGEVAGNLVHRDVLIHDPKKTVFTAKRADDEQDKDFLMSTDMWFRPTNFTVGPDGALYLIDYYRQHVETPLSIPEDLKEEMDFMEGDDRGRIYRIVPKGTPPLSLEHIKVEKTAEDYVEWLTHPNKWYRTQAQRMLIELEDDSVVPLLLELTSGHENGAVRLQALYLVEALGGLKEEHVVRALKDEEPGVRIHALRLAEQFPVLRPEMIELKDDDYARVVMQAALSMGNFSSGDVISALAEVLTKHYSDHWMRLAVLSSEAGSSMALLNFLDEKTSFFESWDKNKERFLHDFTYITAARGNEADVISLIGELHRIPAASAAAVWKGFAGGVKRSGGELSELVKEKLTEVTAPGGEEIQDILKDVL